MYYEGKAKVRRITEKGEKQIIEHYIIQNVESFAEAELRLSEDLSAYNVDYDVFFISRSRIMEIVNEKEEEKPFFKATLVATYVNESNKESDRRYDVLVCAKDIDEASKLMGEYISQGLEDMRLDGIAKTRILDLI